ncbi:uncharacterized protein LOC118188429 [Stegodyphus dumicola]|uniref:uncharacterized protein LOC118188429 n=1 Tax=Stegodyphus dumicola TaxID=202533 RepID=UPI0015AD68E3|nr:uncharacterized protein LOC118188429 [Stegodyphus dumicola]
MKSLLVVLLLAIAAQQAYSQACHMREVDLCMAIGMFHYQSNGVPADEDKVNEWCETMKEVEDCMGNYSSKCLSPLQREVLGLFSDGDAPARSMCTPGSEIRARYLQHAECLAEGAESDEFKTHMRDLQVAIETLFDVQFKQRFPLMCCGFRRFYESIDGMTGRRCGDGAVEMTRNIMSMIISDLPETLCKRYEPQSQECKAVLPPSGTPSKGEDNKSQLGKLLDTVFGNL